MPVAGQEFIAEDAKLLLEEAGFKKVSVEPSAICRSPHDYVYVYLTPKEHEGTHFIVSEEAEYARGSGRLLCGRYPHYEKEGTHHATVDTIEEAVAWCVKIAGDRR